MSISYPTLVHFSHSIPYPLYAKRSTTVENSLQIHPFYAKQTQFYAFFAPNRRFYKKQTQFQTQFKANLTQNKPNLSQFKAKTNPIKAGTYGHRETQITFDLAGGISIKSYVTQKTSVATEIMRKG